MDDQRSEMGNKEGIGGWLIFVVIALIVTPIRLGISLNNEFLPLFNSMSLFEAYPNLQAMIYVEAIINVIFGVSAIILLILMTNKDRRFPKLMIIFYVSNLIFVLADAIYVSQIQVLEQFMESGDSAKEIIRAIVGTSIWVPYMLVSTRVKQTFIK